MITRSGNERENRIALFLCALIAEMDLAVNNLINTFFISRGLGEDGTAAYEITMPCMFVVCAFMALSYNGTQAVCSKDYGAGNRGAFVRHKNAGYSWALLLMAALALMFAILRDVILEFLGANDSGRYIAGLCAECYTMFLPCFLLQGFFCIACCLLFLEERKPLVITNIILYACAITGNVIITAVHPAMSAYIGMNWISYAAADIYLIAYFVRNRGQSAAALTGLNLRFGDVSDELWTGLPDFVEYAMAAAMTLVCNLYVLYRFSSSLVAGLGVFEAVENIPEMLCVGFSFLVTASLGVRRGGVIASKTPDEKKDADVRLRDEAHSLTRFAIIGGGAAALSIIFMAKPIVGSFLGEGGDTSGSAVWLIRSYAAGFIFYLINSGLVCYYKLVRAFPQAHTIFILEAFVFPLLARIVMGELFGVKGFCLGGFFAEMLTFLVNLCFARKIT